MMWFLNMKISKKLLILTVISSLLIGIVGFVGYYYTKRGNEQVKELYEDNFVMLDISQDMRQQNRAREGLIFKLITADKETQPKRIEQLSKRDKDFEDLVTKLEKMDLSAEEKKILSNIKISSSKFLDLEKNIITLVNAGKPQEALLQYIKGEAISEEIANVVRDLVKYQEKEAGIVSKENQEDYKQTITILIGIITLSIFVSFFLGQFISRIISKPLENLVREATLIASGDISSKDLVINGQDEVGKLTAEFNSMKTILRQLIKNVAQASGYLAASSEELTASAEQSAQAANQVAVSISEVATGADKQVHVINETTAVVEQMSAGIQQVAINTNQVAGKSGQAAERAKEGGKSVERAVTQMANIEETVNNSAAVVTKLGERSKEIGQIVDTISGIAGQTNLLALNAAIEAARAGEQGRGFAVVAEEVRKLAEQSQDAAKKISTLISEIQGDTNKAVVAMSEGTREVKIGTEVVTTAGHAFGEIAVLVTEVSDQVKEISAAIQQMASGSQHIVSSVKEIDELSKSASGEAQTVSAATEEQSASMEEIASSSQSLAKMAQDLQEAVSKFRV